MKKRYLFTLALIVGLFSQNNAQTVFRKSFGGAKDDSGRSMDICPDGGYIMAGYSKSFNTTEVDDIYVVKANAAGEEVWSKTFAGAKTDMAHFVTCVPGGGFVITGTTNSYSADGKPDAFLMKIDDSGNMLWQKFYGGGGDDLGKEVRPTSDGGFIIVGYTSSFSSYYDAMLVKTDANGNQQWIKNYGSNNYYDNGYSVRQTPDGGYIFVGKQMYSAQLWDADTWLVKTDANGNMEWNKTYGGQDEEEGQYISLTPDGGYIFASDSQSNTAGNYDALVIKTDASGNQVWRKLFGGSGKDIAKSIEPTNDGGYIMGGITRTNLPNPNYWILKMTDNGDFQWDTNYGGSNHEHLYIVKQTADNGYIVFGYESSLAGPNGQDYWLIKTDAQGTLLFDNKTATLKNTVTVFPNPNNGSFTISLSEREQLKKNISFRILDASGRMVVEKPISFVDNSTEQVAIDFLSPGMYFVELISGNERSVKKITVQ